jgi:hypothetical protein
MVERKENTGGLNLVLGLTTSVGSVLYSIVATFVGVVADTSKSATATLYYSYRYIPIYGEVYYDDYYDGLGWYDHAVSVARQTFGHYWGTLIGTDNIQRQATYDNPNPRLTQLAPHWINEPWIAAKAYNQWYYGLPYYYEDWND